jgi:hypothetical protein
MPNHNNGRSIYKPIETAYLHADSNDYGWGAVLNTDANYQARGFWTATDRLHHITWKELRAIRHAVESFPPYLKGRRVLLHEDNTAVVAALAIEIEIEIFYSNTGKPVGVSGPPLRMPSGLI